MGFTQVAFLSGNTLVCDSASIEAVLLLQAFGAKQYALVGYVWQRAIIIMGLLCIPISVLLLFAQPILLATGQTPTVAAMTASYIRCVTQLDMCVCHAACLKFPLSHHIITGTCVRIHVYLWASNFIFAKRSELVAGAESNDLFRLTACTVVLCNINVQTNVCTL